jgi:hypothetical protein
MLTRHTENVNLTEIRIPYEINHSKEKLMNAPTSPAVAEQSHPVEAILEPATRTENGSERIRSSVARLASSSVSELEGLASELQRMQEFLKSEVGRVQGEIESVLSGINIIIETIAPWKSTKDLPVPPKTTVAVRAGGPGGKS